MSWRSIQLGTELCDQDQLIMSLFGSSKVTYQGSDSEFSAMINNCPDSDNLILIINSPHWASDIITQILEHLGPQRYKNFYIGINRYQILGNDTNLILPKSTGPGIISLFSIICNYCGYIVTKSGHLDNDRGRYFNFVQPLTWIYGTTQTNKSN